MKRKRVALVLVLALVLTMVPVTAMADGSDVAAIGSVGYESLAAAVAAADDGDTVVVTANHAVSVTTSTYLGKSDEVEIYSCIDVEKKITIDWNGKKVTANTGSDNIVLINVQNGGDLTLMDSVGGGSVSVTSDVETYSLLCCLDESSKMTVEGGEYRLNKGMKGQGLVYAGANETTVIRGGTFCVDNGGTLQNGSPWIFNVRGQNERHILVSGGSFNADVLHQYYPFEVQTPNTRALQKNGDWYTMIDAVAYTTENEWSSRWYRNEVGYPTLAEAVAAAEDVKTKNDETSDPEEVTMVALCSVADTLVIDDFDLTIHTNGNTILWTGSDDKPIITVADDVALTMDAFEPVRSGYEFLGWYTDAACENAFDFSNGVVPAGTSLYALWEEIPENGAAIPETGDGMGLFVFAGLALISLLGTVALKRKEQF